MSKVCLLLSLRIARPFRIILDGIKKHEHEHDAVACHMWLAKNSISQKGKRFVGLRRHRGEPSWKAGLADAWGKGGLRFYRMKMEIIVFFVFCGMEEMKRSLNKLCMCFVGIAPVTKYHLPKVVLRLLIRMSRVLW